MLPDPGARDQARKRPFRAGFDPERATLESFGAPAAAGATMPTKREEEERAAAHTDLGGGSPAPGWYPDPSYPTREWFWDGARWTRRFRKTPTASPGWYPDPTEDTREWHWDGTRWSGRHRPRRKRNNFAGTYNLLPTWAQITIPFVVALVIIGVIAGGGESDEDGFTHPGIERIERERAQRERELEEELTERRLTQVAGSERA